MAKAQIAIAFAALAITAIAGCREPLGITAPELPDYRAHLPSAAGQFAPAHVQVKGDVTGAQVSDIDACAGCHADVFAQQQASAHAWSSFNNPVYRYSIEALRRDVGNKSSRMCGGCHDIALLVDGALDDEVRAADPRAHAGVTCRVCHGMTEATVDGNGSFTLVADKIVMPKAGDDASVEAHKKSAAPIRGQAMCGSCHRGFLSRATGNSHFLPGMDELSGHAQSPYARGGLARIDSVEAVDCIGCHMAKEPATRGDAAAKNGMIASHRFTGGHTWLAQMIGDDEQLAAAQKRLVGAVSVDVTAASVDGTWSFPAERATVAAGQTVEFDVAMRNRHVGHRFPAGVLDAQDAFLEVSVRDQRGRLIGQSGALHKAGKREDGAHILRALVADSDGHPRFARDVQNFAAVIVNHTIAPRDVAVVRYRFKAPDDVALPLSISATLWHRSRNLIVAKLACEEAKSARGVAFDAFERAADRVPPNPCLEPVLTKIGSDELELGATASGTGEGDIERLYELGMGLGRVVSERLEEARAPLSAALALEPAPPLRAKIWAALAKIAGRQGKTDEALEFANSAEEIAGALPSLAMIRGNALAKVWRWEEAEVEFTKAAKGAPGNSTAWRALAIARGSLGDHPGALEATAAGLALSPRDADMLRVQALALKALPVSADLAAAALDAFDSHRPPDRAADIRIQCAKSVPSCALERQPVHTHELN